jgi:hypothetical protein
MNAGETARPAGIDVADGGMGVRAAHECRLQHAGKAQVVDEAALADASLPMYRVSLTPPPRRNLPHSAALHAGYTDSLPRQARTPIQRRRAPAE